MVIRCLPTALFAVLVAAPLCASAGPTVRVKMAELRVQPSDNAFSRMRLGSGRPVNVLGKTDDGRWLKVRAELERADDLIKLEGWVEAEHLKGVDLASLSTVGGGSAPAASAWDSSSGSDPVVPASTGGDSDFFGSDKASSSADGWDTAASGSGSGSAWGETSSPSPAAETEKPAEEPWGSSGSESSESSADAEWDAGEPSESSF